MDKTGTMLYDKFMSICRRRPFKTLGAGALVMLRNGRIERKNQKKCRNIWWNEKNVVPLQPLLKKGTVQWYKGYYVRFWF